MNGHVQQTKTRQTEKKLDEEKERKVGRNRYRERSYFIEIKLENREKTIRQLFW